jgi:hypothetical protein
MSDDVEKPLNRFLKGLGRVLLKRLERPIQLQIDLGGKAGVSLPGVGFCC